MLANQWMRNFSITNDDIDWLTNYLIEKETPLTTREIARLLVQQKLEKEQSEAEARYKDLQVYNPSKSYEIGDRLMFSHLEYAIGAVTDIRDGHAPNTPPFRVIKVVFDNPNHNAPRGFKEFAAEYSAPHALADIADTIPQEDNGLDVETILNANPTEILSHTLEALRKHKELRQVAGYWFAKDLVLDINIGTLHLAEAVLEMANGGPLTAEEIIEQIGGISTSPLTLQVFSLNLAMSQDSRFDEVGPLGRVMWYLKRFEHEAVYTPPQVLRYKPIQYDEELLTEDMEELETELDDELTAIDFVGKLSKATTHIIYPHRRAGTLPLNAKTRQIFPQARTPRIFVHLIDSADGQRFNGWVVHEFDYVYGLWDYYTKYRLPIGAYITVARGEHENEILLSHEGHNAHKESLPVFTVSTTQIGFELKKRPIGATFDPLLILGVDDLNAIDELAKFYSNKTLVTILRAIIGELGRLYYQNAVHFTTIYSAVNVLRRCPPGPIFATLRANAEFEEYAKHYWRLASQS